MRNKILNRNTNIVLFFKYLFVIAGPRFGKLMKILLNINKTKNTCFTVFLMLCSRVFSAQESIWEGASNHLLQRCLPRLSGPSCSRGSGPDPPPSVSSPQHFGHQPVLWIQILWICIRIQDFGPIWIRIQGYTNNFIENTIFFFSKSINFFNLKNKMSPKEIFAQFESLNCEFIY